MEGVQDLRRGVEGYVGQEYIRSQEAIRRAMVGTVHPVSYAVLHTLQAVNNIQLCDYSEAVLQLNDVLGLLGRWEEEGQEGYRVERLVLRAKVLANLVVVGVVRGEGRAEGVAGEMLEVVEMGRDQEEKMVLMRTVVKSLVGWGSFEEWEGEFRGLGARLKQLSEGGGLSGRYLREQMPNPIFLCSMAIGCHLQGNLKDAVTLQQIAYSLTRSHQPIAAVLSLRHLYELSVEMGRTEEGEYYRQCLEVLMGREELSGVAGETLFRGYGKKMGLAGAVMGRVRGKERELGVGRKGQEWMGLAVGYQLKMQRKHAQQKDREGIDHVLTLLKEDEHVLRIMKESQFVQQAMARYQQAIEILERSVRKAMRILNYRYFVGCLRQKGFNLSQTPRKSRVIEIDLKDYAVSSERSKEKRRGSSSRRRRQEFASTLYLPKELIHANRQADSLGKSRLSVHPLPFHTSNYTSSAVKSQIKVDSQQKDERKHYQIAKVDKKASQSEVVRFQSRTSLKASGVGADNSLEFSLGVPSQANTARLIKADSKTSELRLNTLKSHESEHSLPESSQSHPPNHNNLFPLSHQPPRLPEQQLRNRLQRTLSRMKRCVHLCKKGGYIDKRHFGSSGNAERYLQVNEEGTRLAWADCEEDISYRNENARPFKEIRGVVYGKVTETMLKEQNRKLEAWRCFSVLMDGRTLDVYCQEEEVLFWVPGLSWLVREAGLGKRVERKEMGRRDVGYSIGRALWKGFCLKMQAKYLVKDRKSKRNSYAHASAYAIIVGAVREEGYKPQYLRRSVV